MKRLCIIGDPVEQSLSPLMHNAALESLGLREEFVFEMVNVNGEGLAGFIESAASSDIAGLSVTMPHKQTIIPMLDILTREANLAQAVNTVTLTEGSLAGSRMMVGHNTDGMGCVKALEHVGVGVRGRTIALLGAGGAARAIAISLGLNGAGGLYIINRTPAKANDVAVMVRKISGMSVETTGLDSMEDAVADADILINATSVGMKGVRRKSIVPGEFIEQHMAVLDIVYEPLDTKLLKDARKVGARAINGAEMLLYQGAAQFKLFTGRDAPLEVMRAALEGTR